MECSINVRSVLFIVLLFSSFSFPLGVLSVIEGRILKSIGIIVKLSVLPFNYVSFVLYVLGLCC